MIEDMGTNYRATRYECVFWRGDVLYFTFRDERREKREVRFGPGDAKEAHRAQVAAQEKADLIRAGRLDPRQASAEESAGRPVDVLASEYVEHLTAQGDTAAHVRTMARFIERWREACGVKRLTDADAVKTQRWLAAREWSARTRNYARAAVLGLCRWASDHGRSPYNPLPAALLPKANEDADRRRLSRALTAEEFPRILAVAPPARRAYYLLAATAGLRWREIARLTWAEVDLEARVIVVQASQAKTKRRAELPLIEAAAEALATIRGPEAEMSSRLFAAEPRLRTWNRDLDRAGIVRTDERGRSADRKCLRMSYATWLAQGGVDLRDAQRLMRHASPVQTANVYTDLRMPNLKAAQERIGLGLSTTNQPESSKPSGGLRHNAKRA